MKKKIYFIAIIMSFLLCFTGCGHKVAVKGDVIFSCSPDNILGLESVYADDGIIYIQFDKNYVFTNEYPVGVQQIFPDGHLNQNDYILVEVSDNAGEPVEIEADDVVVDAETMTLSFPSNGLDPEKIGIVSLFLGKDLYTVYFEDGLMGGDYFAGDCTKYFRQSYNSKFDSWGKLWTETQVGSETSGP